jgi:hypothetical protein
MDRCIALFNSRATHLEQSVRDNSDSSIEYRAPRALPACEPRAGCGVRKVPEQITVA